MKRFILGCVHLFFSFPALYNYKKYLLSTWFLPQRRNKLDHFCYRLLIPVWFRFEYWSETNPDLRTAKQGLLMGGESGAEWAKHYDSSPFPPDEGTKVGSISFSEALPIFEDLKNVLRNKINPTTLIQIGSSSGREIAWFARQFPHIRCIGSDIYRSVIEYSSNKYRGPNLSFVTLPAHQLDSLIQILPEGEDVIFFSSGSLQYVQPEHLKDFFTSLTKFSRSIEVYLLETADDKKGSPNALEESLPRGNFSFTHNYMKDARSAGLEVINSSIIHPYLPKGQFKGHENTVHFYFVARKT